LELWDG